MNSTAKFNPVFSRDQALKIIKDQTDVSNYKNFFPQAREQKRKITLIVGPTNSGKTYQALEDLKNGESGAYLAPLRLLALEKFEEINLTEKCNLITGEEKIIDDEANFNSQTIETFSTVSFYETVIIDEIQMIFDEHRGWAWTRALFGANCTNLFLVGSEAAVSVVTKLCEHLDEELKIIHKTRLQPLTVHGVRNINHIPDQSALIVFSRKQVMEYKWQLEKLGRTVATVYGALSPEVRKQQAARFRSGQAQILIATDSIQFGLNLPLKEVIFAKIEKFDGKNMRPLNSDEIKQISGRAGRYGLQEAGLVSALGNHDLGYIKKALAQPYNVPTTVYLFPTLDQVKTISTHMKTESIAAILKYFANHCIPSNSIFSTNSYSQTLEVARIVDQTKLDVNTKFGILGIPVNVNIQESEIFFRIWLDNIRDNENLNFYPLANLIEKTLARTDDSKLKKLEEVQKILITFKSLCLKFEHDPDEMQLAIDSYAHCDEHILELLAKKRKDKKKR